MTNEDEVARALAFFQRTVDIALLRRALAAVAPRAARQVRRFMQRGGEGAVPVPAEVAPAAEPATETEALSVLASTTDFALLQALTRAIGRRVESLSRPPDLS